MLQDSYDVKSSQCSSCLLLQKGKSPTTRLLARPRRWIEEPSHVSSTDLTQRFHDPKPFTVCVWLIKESGAKSLPLGDRASVTFSDHHLERYSCGSPLKFLLCSAWSTVRMKESIIRFMSEVKGSKEGCWATERLKCPS